jgi:hypothetical protein
MKTKTLLCLCLFIGIGLTQLSAQTLQKGAVVAIRTYTFTLKPDVKMNQLLDFWINKYDPEFEKCYPGLKIFVLSGDRGEKKNQFGELWYFESVKVRDKYWATEGDTTSTDFDKAATKKLKPLNDEWDKFVSAAPSVYTDWIIK